MDREYSFPKYKIICDVMRQRIADGQYKKNNNQIPDELTLCQEFNCSRMTMKKALDILVSEGIIYRKRGHGSFVLENNTSTPSYVLQAYDQDLVSFSGLTEGECESKILQFQLIFADEFIANKLNINEEDSVYKIVRLRKIDEEPYLIETIYMSTNLISGITLEILKGSIYQYVENVLKLKISSAQRIMRASPSKELDIKHLMLEENEPVLEVEQTTFLSNGKIFEYSVSRYRYDKIEFTSFAMRK